MKTFCDGWGGAVATQYWHLSISCAWCFWISSLHILFCYRSVRKSPNTARPQTFWCTLNITQKVSSQLIPDVTFGTIASSPRKVEMPHCRDGKQNGVRNLIFVQSIGWKKCLTPSNSVNRPCFRQHGRCHKHGSYYVWWTTVMIQITLEMLLKQFVPDCWICWDLQRSKRSSLAHFGALQSSSGTIWNFLR